MFFCMAAPVLAEPSFSVLHSFGIWTNMTGFFPRAKLVQGADGTLYGTASSGENHVRGTVFKVRPDGSGFAVLKWFTNSMEGMGPRYGLVLSGNTLYGTTESGGTATNVVCYTNRFGQIICTTYAGGVVFKVNTDGSGYTVLKSFSATNAEANPKDLLLVGSTLYGPSSGTLFKINIDGSGYSVIRSFNAGINGLIPNAVVLGGNTLYGTTQGGGSSGYGTVFKVNTDGSGFAVLKSFAAGDDGDQPDSRLVLSGSTLYGGAGHVLFKINTSGSGFTVIHTFNNVTDGSGPNELLLHNGTLYGTARWGGGYLLNEAWSFGTVFKLQTDGSGFTVLHRFTRRDTHPLAGLVLSGDTLFGTTPSDGVYGTVFAINTNGSGYTVLKQFGYSDGVYPQPNLVSHGGALYGAAQRGGSSDLGTVFKVNTDGSGYTTLKHMAESEGNPTAGVVSDGITLYGGVVPSMESTNFAGSLFRMNPDGNGYWALTNQIVHASELVIAADTLYGTTRGPGVPSDGILFKISTNGSGFTILKMSTIQQESDGREFRGLLLKDNTLYGVATWGGNFGGPGWGYGTVFAMNTDGSGFTVLKQFTGSDGANPYSGLALSSSTFYGATLSGGNSGWGTIFKINTDGSDYTVLKHFDSNQPGDGLSPFGTLVLRGDTLYGAASDGGTGHAGTLFKLQTDGSGYTVLHRFSGRDGRDPMGNLLWNNGTLYGTTAIGGELGQGTVFALSVASPIPLHLTRSGSSVVLSWSDPVFALQSAPAVTGPFTNVSGAISPHTNSASEGRQFFRLISN